MLNSSLYLSDKEDWETPDILFNKLNLEFSFTLDACASRRNTKCEEYFSIKDNALDQKWIGAVWMNPPYGRGIVEFVRKAYLEAKQNAEIVVCLLPVRSDTRWWHDYVMKSKEIRLLTRRLSFTGSNNKAPFPACIVIYTNALKSRENPALRSYQV